MTTALAEPATTRSASHPLLAVARLEIRRFLSHPLFLVTFVAYCWFLSGPVLLDPEPNLHRISESWSVITGLFLGVTGFVVAHRLTRSTRPAGELIVAAPLDPPARSLALCLVAVVPLTAAVVGGALTLLLWEASDASDPLGSYAALTRGDVWGYHATVLLATVGGPLLGVAVGRWWRWPMAGAVVAIVLVAWSVLSGFSTTDFWTTLNHQAAPFALPVTGAESEEAFRQGGSWPWRVAYVVALCGLAGLAAVLHGAVGELRRRLLLSLGVVLVAAVGCVLLATVLGHDGLLVWRA